MLEFDGAELTKVVIGSLESLMRKWRLKYGDLDDACVVMSRECYSLLKAHAAPYTFERKTNVSYINGLPLFVDPQLHGYTTLKLTRKDSLEFQGA